MNNSKFSHIYHRYNNIKYLDFNEIISINNVKSKANMTDKLIKYIMTELMYSSSREMS